MWRVWRLRFDHFDILCPIDFADPFGLVVVMARAAPVTQSEVDEVESEYRYPGISAEPKAADWGRVHGRIVCVDYRLPDADLVSDKRQYFASFLNAE